MMINFIAELGQNHNGSLETAKRMVDSLIGSGVTWIKTAKRNYFPEYWKDQPYKNKHSYGETYYDHRKALELSDDEFIDLARYCETLGFKFTSSFTDLEAFEFLVDIGLDTVKIASSRNVDHKLLRAVNKWGGRVILSTGMMSHTDLCLADTLLKNCEVIRLQCTSSYPTYDEDINLLQMLKYEFDGISGHWPGILPDTIAYTLGARWIERHYTLDKNDKGGDHHLSLERQDIDNLFATFSRINKMMGNDYKEILPCEQPAIKKLRHDLL